MADSESVTLVDLIAEIDRFPALVRTAITFANEDQLPDVLGAVHSTQTRIQAAKLKAASEVPDGTTGKQWAVERGRRAERSYNTPGLLHNIGEQTASTGSLALLMHLIDRGVLSLTWHWTPLDQMVKQLNLELRVARHEIEDDDPDYDIGEFWKDGSARYVPIDNERQAT